MVWKVDVSVMQHTSEYYNYTVIGDDIYVQTNPLILFIEIL